MKVVVKGKGSVSLTQQDYVAEGGQGKVYAKGGMAYKVYHDPSSMIPEGKIRELAPLPSPPFSRPHDLLVHPKTGQVIGYTTRFVDDAWVLCQLFPRSFRDREGLTHKHTFHLAQAMRDGIQTAHKANILLVDGNEMNFLVDRKFKNLAFIDTDSYQTRSYPAVAIMESIRDRQMTHTHDFNEGTDWFSFAIVAFQLLVGIHPYKGKHPSLKGFDARMKANVSVFHRDVRVPKAAYDFKVIPADWRAWFEAVLDRGERCPPPGGLLQAVLIKPVVKTVTGAQNLVLEPLDVFDDVVTGVWTSGHHLIVATASSLWMDARRVGDYDGTQSVGLSTTMGIPVAVQHKQDIPTLVNCQSRQAVPFGLNAQRVTDSDGTIYLKNRDKVLAVTLTDVGNSVVASTRLVASVLPQASLLFSGGVVQNMLGSTFVSLFSGTQSHQVRIKELDSYRVLDGKWDEGARGGVLMVIATKKGKTDRLAFRFDPSFMSYDLRKVEDIQSGDLNFVVTDAGVCVLLDGDNDCIELSATKKGSTQVKTITDAVIGGDMRLFKRGAQVLVARGIAVFAMKMK